MRILVDGRRQSWQGMMMRIGGPLVPLDLSPVSWSCSFCATNVDIADDMLPVLYHKAFLFPLMPDDLLSQCQASYRGAAKLGRIERLMGAHLMKHPEHWNSPFDVASVPARYFAQNMLTEVVTAW